MLDRVRRKLTIKGLMPCFCLTQCKSQYCDCTAVTEVGGWISLKQWSWLLCDLQGILVREHRNEDESSATKRLHAVYRANGLKHRPSDDTSTLPKGQVRPATSQRGLQWPPVNRDAVLPQGQTCILRPHRDLRPPLSLPPLGHKSFYTSRHYFEEKQG